MTSMFADPPRRLLRVVVATLVLAALGAACSSGKTPPASGGPSPSPAVASGQSSGSSQAGNRLNSVSTCPASTLSSSRSAGVALRAKRRAAWVSSASRSS